jgi:protein CpxP
MQLYHPNPLFKGHTMNTIRNSIIIGLAALSLGSASFAADTAGARPDRQQMHAKWGERAAARQQQLHDALKLTPAQESAWGSYLAASKPAMRGERGERGERGQRAAWASMPAPERMQKRIDMAKQHVAMMESRLGALTTFYAVLTPAQQKTFDAASHHEGRGGHRGHHMGRHGGQHAAG